MKITAEKIDNYKIALEMEIPQPEVAKALDKACKKLAEQVNIPGFRKGKAPRKVLEMRIGKEALLEEAFELLWRPAYIKALADQNVTPVSQPEIDVVTLNETEPLVFKATVVQKPTVTLGEYKGIKASKNVEEITEEKVAADLEDMRNRAAKMVVVEDAVIEKGDMAIIDFKGFIDGEAFAGGEGSSYPLEIGSGSFIPGFEEQLIGAKPGEERDVNLTFPEDYHAKDYAGKAVLFQVKVQDVKRKEIPELDDDFAREISEFDTLADLKAERKEKLEKAAEQKAEREFQATVVKTAVENTEIDVPEVMVEDQINTMIEEMEINLENKGIKLDRYLEYTKTTRESLRENYREAALFEVKNQLVMEAIGKAENIDITEEDITEEMENMAKAYKTDVAEVRKVINKSGRLELLKDSIMQRKAAKFVLEKVVAE